MIQPIHRLLWLEKLFHAWSDRSIVWLSGVRGAGKATLASMVPDAVVLDCGGPSTARDLVDPELFLGIQRPGPVIVLDRVHLLPDPSLLLKIGADEHPYLRILAIGPSTVAATRKYSDSLTGRKRAIYLSPVLWEECADPFGIRDLDRRLLHGGLPGFLLADALSPRVFPEWMDMSYTRDAFYLFRVMKQYEFCALFGHLLRRSGERIDIDRLARLTELTRPTVKSYLEILQVTHAIHLLRPFWSDSSEEIAVGPKTYAFDTGFVASEKGWRRVKHDDRVLLWRHLVLDSLRFRQLDDDIFYWRDKAGREVDFVLRRGDGRVDTFSCQIDPDWTDAAPVDAFRRRHPQGRDHIVVPFATRSYRIRRRRREFTVCGMDGLPSGWIGID